MRELAPGTICRFCSSEAVGLYALDRGCVCYPDDREQALCAQHVVRATPLGGFDLVAGPGLEDFLSWEERQIKKGLKAMTRRQVYALIDGERRYQDEVWGGLEHDRQHSLEEWIGFILERLARLGDLDGRLSSEDEDFRRVTLRKVAALAVAAMEVHGAPAREQSTKKPARPMTARELMEAPPEVRDKYMRDAADSVAKDYEPGGPLDIK